MRSSLPQPIRSWFPSWAAPGVETGSATERAVLRPAGLNPAPRPDDVKLPPRPGPELVLPPRPTGSAVVLPPRPSQPAAAPRAQPVILPPRPTGSPDPGTRTRSVLFLCTANYYRSRLAEALFNHYAQEASPQWRAHSRGLSDARGLGGASREVSDYLTRRGISPETLLRRNPVAASLDDLLGADLIVALNRTEHEKRLTLRFAQLVRDMEQVGKLRYWNVYDLPARLPWVTRLLNSGHLASQPEDSSAEHIDFAVRALVSELTGEPVRGRGGERGKGAGSHL